MTRSGHAGALLLVCAGLLLAAAASRAVVPSPIKGLTHAPLLVRAYDLVYDADFAGAESELKRACGPAPAQACDVISVAAQWWRIYFDLDNRSLDQAFKARLNALIAAGEKWVAREPERAEAWFYLGAAYAVRVQYHGQRLEFLSAARDGKRIKASLEKALALDPALDDANAGLGLYQYYADVAPAVLKVLRWFLGLPGGDRVKGLEQLRRARERGVLLKAEATYQLHLVDIWYEDKSGEALELLADLHAQYPHNPLFLLNAAQVHEIYRSDRAAALAVYRSLIDGARDGSLREPILAETWGRLGAAAQLAALAEPDRAIDELRRVIEGRPAVPYGAVAQAQLDLGHAADQLGLRDQAVAAYRAAVAAVPAGDPRQVRRAAEQGLSRVPDQATAEATRLSLEGWRAFERGDASSALADLDRAVQLRPDDGVHRYRRGRVLSARQDLAGARSDLERALQVRPLPPPPFVAASYYELGAIFEASADRARAIAMYESALRAHAGSAETRSLAQRALARLR
jgi:predicted negative regulator of RcsB-dependent stress response